MRLTGTMEQLEVVVLRGNNEKLKTILQCSNGIRAAGWQQQSQNKCIYSKSNDWEHESL